MKDNEPLAEPSSGSAAVSWNEAEQQDALRWRRAILKLSETLLTAADRHQELSPFLLEAMHYALENLLVHGDERDLMALEEWLIEESEAMTLRDDATALRDEAAALRDGAAQATQERNSL
jgi:hypothetical protein